MKQFIKDEHAEPDISQVMAAIIAIIVAGILVGALLPSAITSNAEITSGGYNYIGGTNISGNGSSAPGNTNIAWNTGLRATYAAIPIMAVISGMILFVTIVTKLSKG